MDPLSVIASIVTILGITHPIAHALRRILSSTSSKSDVIALINDISDLETILRQIDETCLQAPSQRPPWLSLTSGDIPSLLERAQVRLLQLERLLREVLICDTSSKSCAKVNRFRWLKREAQFQRIHKDINGIRSNLSLAISAHTSNRLCKIETSLSAMARLAQDMKDQQSGSMDRFRKEGENYKLQYIEQTSFSSICEKQASPTAVSSNIETSFCRQFKHDLVQSRSTPFETRDHSFTEVRIRAPAKDKGAVSRRLHNLDQGYKSRCLCGCHRPRHVESAHRFAHLFGLLFLGYRISQGGDFVCKRCKCFVKDKSSISLEVKYLFPTWFLAWTIIYLSVCFTRPGPSLSLSILRLKNDFDITFYLARGASLQGLVLSFEFGHASALDMSFNMRRTLLHYAVENDDYRMTKLLLQRGADIRHIDSDHRSALSMIWERLQARYSDSETLGAWQNLMDQHEHDDETEGLTSFHKEMFEKGLKFLSVQRLEEDLVNIGDEFGRTPIYWAALRGDHEVLSHLLGVGANLELRSNDGTTPLMAAARGSCIRCVRALLAGGIDPKARDKYGRSALHWLSQDKPYIVERLICGGVKPDACDQSSATALHVFATKGFAQSCAVLIRHGANVNHCDDLGKTPLTRAIAQNHHRVICALLSKGGKYAGIDAAGHTVFHVSAWFADVRTFRLITDHLDSLAQDSATWIDIEYGCGWRPDSVLETPSDCISKRLSFLGDRAESGLRVAFNDMVVAARRRKPQYEKNQGPPSYQSLFESPGWRTDLVVPNPGALEAKLIRQPESAFVATEIFTDALEHQV